MGTSYEGLLVTANLDEVRAALISSNEHALIARVAGFTALTPIEQYGETGDITSLAADLSRACSCGVLAHSVYDSDVLTLWVYRDGELVHRYVSEIGALGELFEDHDGLMKIELDGVVYLESDPARPHGPSGAEAQPFLPFSAGEPDFDAITAVLSRDFPGWAETRHRAFLRALRLDSPLLRDSARHIDPREISQAVQT